LTDRRKFFEPESRMDLKDVTTPLATIVAVWLAASFALRNERRKKTLELRTAQIDRIADLVNRSSTNLLNHTGALASIVEINARMWEENSHAPGVPLETLHNWINDLDEHPAWGIDRELYRQCAHDLEFHRESEWLLWERVVPGIIDEKNTFFMISMPGNGLVDMKDQTRSVEDILAFAVLMRRRVRELQTMRRDILDSLRKDFRNLTRPAAPTLRSLTAGVLRGIRHFLTGNKTE